MVRKQNLDFTRRIKGVIFITQQLKIWIIISILWKLQFHS